MQRYEHEVATPELARVQDHDDLLEMVRLHSETARVLERERSPGRSACPHRQLIALSANMRMDLVVDITGHVQDHFLAHPYVDLFPIGHGLATRDRDVDGQGVVSVE